MSGHKLKSIRQKKAEQAVQRKQYTLPTLNVP